MALRADTAQLISGRLVASRYAGHGVRGSDVPSTGVHGAALLFQHISLPADASSEFRWVPSLTPTVGTFALDENSSYVLTGAPDGLYALNGVWFKNGVSQGASNNNITIGMALASLTAAVRQLKTATAGLNVVVRQVSGNAVAVNAFVQAWALQVSLAASGAVLQGRTASVSAAGAVSQRLTRAALLTAQVQAASPELAVQLLAAVRAQHVATVGLAAYITDGNEPLPVSLFTRFPRRRIRRIGRVSF